MITGSVGNFENPEKIRETENKKNYACLCLRISKIETSRDSALIVS